MEQLGIWALRTARGFVIKHKGVFMKAIIAFANTLPEPAREGDTDPNKKVVGDPNSPLIMDVFDKFFEYFHHEGRVELLQAARKIFIFEYDHDPDYRNMFQFFLEEFVELVMSGKWKPRPIGHPSGTYWTEPRNHEGDHGLYNGRKFRTLIK